MEYYSFMSPFLDYPFGEVQSPAETRPFKFKFEPKELIFKEPLN